jgi:hypothetical protein
MVNGVVMHQGSQVDSLDYRGQEESIIARLPANLITEQKERRAEQLAPLEQKIVIDLIYELELIDDELSKHPVEPSEPIPNGLLNAI